MTYKIEMIVEGHDWTTLPEHIKDENDMVRIMSLMVSELESRLIDLHIGCMQQGVIDSYHCPKFDHITEKIIDLAAECDSIRRRVSQ